MAVFMGEARAQGEGDIRPCRLEAEGQSLEAERQKGIQLFLGFQPVQELHIGALHEVPKAPCCSAMGDHSLGCRGS